MKAAADGLGAEGAALGDTQCPSKKVWWGGQGSKGLGSWKVLTRIVRSGGRGPGARLRASSLTSFSFCSAA